MDVGVGEDGVPTDIGGVASGVTSITPVPSSFSSIVNNGIGDRDETGMDGG